MKNLFIFILAGLFLFSFASAFEFDNVISDRTDLKIGDSYTIGDKVIPYNELWKTYKPIEITNAFGLGEVLYKDVLTKHSNSCGSELLCEDIWEVELTNEGALLDDMLYDRILEDGSRIEGKVRWNNFYYWGSVLDYTTKCFPAKLTEEEIKNETKPYETCIQVESGSHEDWVQFNIGDKFKAGYYKVKSVAEKRPDYIIDYIPVVMGKPLLSRATWGNISTGSQAEVILNSPANNSIQYTKTVTTNASANVTNGAYLTNASLNLSVNGGAWEIRNTTNLGMGGNGLVSYYTLDETSGTTTIDSINNNNGTNVGATINQVGKIDKAYSFDGTNDYTTLGSSTSHYYNNEYTISFWINFNDITGQQVPLVKSISSSGTNNYKLRKNTDHKLEVFAHRTSGTVNAITSTTVSASTWYYIVINTKYGSGGYTKLYVNNVERASFTNDNAISPKNQDTSLTLGVDQWSSGNFADYFNGKIDEVAIWNRSLSQAEITALYNSGAGSRPTTTTTTTIFTNTFSAGDVVDFNYLFGDSDGDVGKSETRRFTIDSGAPTINLSYPTALIDYGKLNQTLQLNFTATDTNLDKVWYNYNGTNVTITGATSGVANLSNITLSSKKNVTIYANDTAGNLNTTTFSWDYKVFENSQSYINQTYAQVSNPFIVNITSQNISSFKLNYNGTNYSANTFTSGSNTIGTVNILAPIVSADTNISFYWVYVMLDGSTINSDSKNQTIKYIVLGNNYSNLIYNITVKDEFTNTFIPNSNVTMTYEVTYGFTNTSILATKLNFYDFNYSNKNISSNIFTSLYMTGNIIYSAPNYIGRNYYFLENYINSSKNITLYLTGENISYVKAITVTDEAGRGQAATYKQYRVIGGVKTLVASETLGSTGKSTITFIPNVQYTFEFTKSGCDDLTNNIIFYDQSEYIQALSCTAYNPDDYIDPFEGMVATFSPNGVFNVNNATNTSASLFSVNISGTSSFCDSVSVVSFNVYNQLGNTIVNDNGNSCDVLFGSGLFNNFATGSVYILLDSGEEKTLTFKWIKLYSDSDYSNYSILTLLGEVGNSDDILGIDWKFKILISFIGLLGIIIALTIYQRIYNFSNLPILIVADIYIWFMCFIGWGDLNIGASSGGITALVSKYALLILAVIASAGIIATKEDEYS